MATVNSVEIKRPIAVSELLKRHGLLVIRHDSLDKVSPIPGVTPTKTPNPLRG
jgi:hypothetical protein